MWAKRPSLATLWGDLRLWGEKIMDLKTAAAGEEEDMCFVMLELGTIDIVEL